MTLANGGRPAPEPIAQYLRCYVEPVKPAKKGGSGKHRKRGPTTPEGEAIRAVGAPHEGWCFVLDTETTTDTEQALRFGTYAVYGIDRDERMRLYRAGNLTREALDTPHERGFFYDEYRCTPEEIALMRSCAVMPGVECWTRDEFVKEVFYKWVYRYEALCIGHNLPFDLSRLATRWGEAGDFYRGGFWLTLCSCGYDDCFDHPPVRVKHVGKAKDMIAFRTPSPPGRKKRPRPGAFLDTATLGRALLGPGDISLEGLGKRFKADVLKADAPEHGQKLTPEYLDYAAQDVEATWALYRAERELYKLHGTSTPMHKIYSEASLGKAYLRDLGVSGFMDRNPNFPKEVMGYGLAAYYGGRSEVRIRLEPTEVIYCDFKSQYPTVNALMGLQDLLLAECVEVRKCTDEVREWLETLTLSDLQKPETWRRLRCLVKVRPDGDSLPVRTDYGPDGLNIGLNYLTGPPVWYTLADVVAPKLQSGKPPEVIEALEFVPVGRVETKPWALFGDERYTIDLQHQDLFTEVINLRSRIKEDAKKAANEADRRYLNSLQQALKLLANSTSYGVLLEVNQNEPTERGKPVTVYGLGEPQEVRAKVVEEPGDYFAGPLGALIPAGGRLLLAIAERLAADRGMGYAFCDTDSMALARPDTMPREEFGQRVEEIVEWFTPLSPYKGKPPIFEYEDENYWQGEPEPLYFIGVSAKRYALYNQLPDGTYRIRKFSSHGIGTWGKLEEYEPPDHIPEPCDDVYELGGHRWSYDLWYEFVADVESGERTHYVEPKPWLDVVAHHQVTCSTAHLYRPYKNVPGLRPFSFITVLPPLLSNEIRGRRTRELSTSLEPDERHDYEEWQERVKRANRDLYSELKGITYYAPFAGKVAPQDIRRADTHELVKIEHKTLWESLWNYFTHPEWKTADPKGVGVLPRRHVVAVNFEYIGKESNQVASEIAAESEDVLASDATQHYGGTGIAEALWRYPLHTLAEATGVPKQTLHDLRNGARPRLSTLRKVFTGLATLGEKAQNSSGKKIDPP